MKNKFNTTCEKLNEQNVKTTTTSALKQLCGGRMAGGTKKKYERVTANRDGDFDFEKYVEKD